MVHNLFSFFETEEIYFLKGLHPLKEVFIVVNLSRV